MKGDSVEAKALTQHQDTALRVGGAGFTPWAASVSDPSLTTPTLVDCSQTNAGMVVAARLGACGNPDQPLSQEPGSHGQSTEMGIGLQPR